MAGTVPTQEQQQDSVTLKSAHHPEKWANSASFTADGVLFDMDGTLTDSIAAVEAAWTAKANELGMDPDKVIAATHGRRASDNLQELIPSLKPHHVNQEVDKFERSILAFADTPPRSRSGSAASSRRNSSVSRKPSMTAITDTRRRSSVKAFTPAGITPMTGTSPAGSGRNSPTSAIPALSRLKYNTDKDAEKDEDAVDEDPFNDDDDDEDVVDMSVQILPGVKELINSLPEGRYAVATSGAKTYCHGCLNRTGITIPKVCVTADDPRLKRGKPYPDPFLLAAEDLGFDAKRCVVFEDSPSGIKAGVASGATVIAVCTSHPRHKIDSHGAHYIIETMDQVKVVQNADGSLGFTIVY